MTEQAELEISLDSNEDQTYEVRLRFSHPFSDADLELMPKRRITAQFDLARLREQTNDQAVYGRLLTNALFASQEMRTAFAAARSSAEAALVDLRLRLRLSPQAAHLQALRWETLLDPLEPERRLTTDQTFWFSRYVLSHDWRPVLLRPKPELRALIVVANPSNLPAYQLAPVDAPGELDMIRDAVSGAIPLTALAEPGTATIENIFDELRKGYDILSITSHGTFRDNQSYLWLEDSTGQVARIDGDSFIRRLRELENRPRLVILVACRTGGSGNPDSSESAIAALGPRLAEEGIPAVLAMHGSITMQTAHDFMRIFFNELAQGGQIDRAMAFARSQVQDRPDWWIPVLYMRLKSGKISWYNPGFASEDGLRKWPALVASIQDHECTPVIGLDLAESIFGSRHDMARQWAEEHNFPLAPYQREGLPQVSQYLAVNQDPRFTRRSLVRYLCNEVRQRHWDNLSDELRQIDLGSMPRRELLPLLNQLLSEAWTQHQGEPDHPYRVLAELNLPIYLTADPTDLLLHALRWQNKNPHVQICPWNDITEQMAVRDASERGYMPSAQEPLVYYLFGRLEEPESLVLTEDEFFNYLIRTTHNRSLISDDVRAALAENTLLFMGFGFDDWDFRVLLRVLMTQEGRPTRSESAHIATQITPQPGSLLSPDRAKVYLEEYFRGSSISIFWGTHRDFVHELRTHIAGEI